MNTMNIINIMNIRSIMNIMNIRNNRKVIKDKHIKIKHNNYNTKLQPITKKLQLYSTLEQT